MEKFAIWILGGINMGLLIMRLLVAINTYPLDSTYHHVATVFIQNYSLIKENSIDEMANLASVAKSTLTKFAKEIGFDNYKHLKDNADFIENRYDNKYNYLTNIIEFIGERNFSFCSSSTMPANNFT